MVHVVAQYKLGDDGAGDFVQWASDWCLVHDQNILVGICGACGDDDTLSAYEAAACEYMTHYAEACTQT